MAKTKKSTKADNSQHTAPSYSAKGTAGYGNLLEMITGSKLSAFPEYHRLQVPSEHFGDILDDVSRVKQFVITFDQLTAKAFAPKFKHWYSPSTKHSLRSEMDLSHFLSQHLFAEKWQLLRESSPKILPFDQGAIKMRFEYRSRFQKYSTSELREGLSSIRFIRVTQEDRLLGRSIADIPHPLPAATDLRGRCDVVYGLNSQCLPLSECICILPCHDSSAALCCIWLRVEYKIDEDEQSRTTARHQWAIGAYLELLDRVRLYRPNDPPYLDDRPALSNIRQYGYVICGQRVEVWEMTVDIHQGSPTQQDGNQTMCEGNLLLFPTKLLEVFDLTDDASVVMFSQWHESIMTWGLEKYARDYVKTVKALDSARIKPKEWLLDYAAAIGKELPPLVRAAFEYTAELTDQNSMQKSQDESAESSSSVKGLKNTACDDEDQCLPPSQVFTLEKYTKKKHHRCQARLGQKAKQKYEQCPNQSREGQPYCGKHGKKK